MSETTVEWAHLLDDAGSADMYETEAEARDKVSLSGGGLARVEVTIIIPFELAQVPSVGVGA